MFGYDYYQRAFENWITAATNRNELIERIDSRKGVRLVLEMTGSIKWQNTRNVGPPQDNLLVTVNVDAWLFLSRQMITQDKELPLYKVLIDRVFRICIAYK